MVDGDAVESPIDGVFGKSGIIKRILFFFDCVVVCHTNEGNCDDVMWLDVWCDVIWCIFSFRGIELWFFNQHTFVLLAGTKAEVSRRQLWEQTYSLAWEQNVTHWHEERTEWNSQNTTGFRTAIRDEKPESISPTFCSWAPQQLCVLGIGIFLTQAKWSPCINKKTTNGKSWKNLIRTRDHCLRSMFCFLQLHQSLEVYSWICNVQRYFRREFSLLGASAVHPVSSLKQWPLCTREKKSLLFL